MKRAFFGLLAAALATQLQAEEFPFDGDAWDIAASEAEVADYLGQRALKLKGGMAVLNGVRLASGVIEFDIAVFDEFGFSGAVFRMQDAKNFEHFYIRPHLSGKPDASQYTPVFNGVSAWQLYHGEGFGAAADYRFDAWNHIKIVFSGRRAEVYIDTDEPTLSVRKLRRSDSAGTVGVDASSFAPAYFANFQVSPLPAGYVFADAESQTEAPAEGVVSTWLVYAFDSAELAGVTRLDTQFEDGRRWTPLAAEPSGIANLATVQGLAPEKDTVFARLIVNSERNQTRGLRFGYSDAVAVFVNGTLVYRGSNSYRSRDYRYLGTMGLFDTVYPHLNVGSNEIWFAVTEAFGGWGIQAEFDNSDGIVVQTGR